MNRKEKLLLMKHDGRCSFWPNGNWKECCIAHDLEVHDAKCLKNESLRLLADTNLKICVNKKFRGMGSLMYKGIRRFLKIRKKLFRKAMY